MIALSSDLGYLLLGIVVVVLCVAIYLGTRGKWRFGTRELPRSVVQAVPNQQAIANAEYQSKGLQFDISLRFTCDTYSRQKVIVRSCAIPATVEGMFLDAGDNQIPIAPFEILLIYGDRLLASMNDKLPIDWRSPSNLALHGYATLDKGFMRHIPFVGEAIESVLPDAWVRLALWYHIAIDETGRCDYKLHIGPSDNINVRNKCEGTCQL